MKKNDKKPSDSSGRRKDEQQNKAAHNRENKNDNKGRLPGEYPPQEDIMNRRDTQRVGMDVENFSRAIGHENINAHEPLVTRANDVQDEPELTSLDDAEQPQAREMERPVPKNFSIDDDDMDTRSESDVTEEDLQALGPKDLSMDMGDDEQILKNRVWPVDMAAKDLDIPTAESADDDSNEANGSEDEENDFYSLGGDRHEDLEDDPTARS